MTATLRSRTARPSTPTRKRAWAHYLAICGIPLAIWETWNVIAWLADGPEQVTEFRDTSSFSFYVAKFLELGLVILSVFVLIRVIADCRRARKILTFDVMYLMAAATIFWTDGVGNFYMPTILYSSNWVNLTASCGHLPFVVNPDCGRLPDPILFNFTVEVFGVLALAMFMTRVFARWRARWPGISNAKLFGLICVVGLIADLIFETALIAINLWNYPSAPHVISIPLGKGFRQPLPELIGATIWTAMMIAARTFRDDRGLTIFERGLDYLKPRTRKLVTLGALYTFFQFASWGPATVPFLVLGPFSPKWDEMPAHIVNNVCDAPGFTGTRYGPCPGSPGYRMVGRHQLPGKSP